MSSIVVAGDTSGSVTLSVPAVAGSTVLTLPATSGTMLTTATPFSNGQGPAFSAYSGTTTTLSAATWTKIVYDAEEYDTNNNFASSRFTPTVAGYYLVVASILFNSTAANERVVAIYKNGSSYKWSADIQNISNINTTFSCIVYFNGSTDYVECYGYSGNGQTTATSSAQHYFQAAMVRGA